MRHIMISALGIMLAIAIAGCAGTAPAVKKSESQPEASQEGNVIKQNVSIDGGDVYEDCFELKAGQSMKYEFSADGELRFNLHWHTDSKSVKYEVKKVGVTSDKRTFASEQDEYYCLMWRNDGDMPVSLALKCVLP